jgi:hypothetical protein
MNIPAAFRAATFFRWADIRMHKNKINKRRKWNITPDICFINFGKIGKANPVTGRGLQ